MEDLYPIIRPQQPMRPFWMGDSEIFENVLWQVVQGDYLAYFIEMFCECALTPDITGYSFYFSVRSGLDPNDPELLATVWTEEKGSCGCTALIVVPCYTAAVPVGRYAMDLKYLTPAGMLVKTMVRGELDVLPGTNTTFSQLNEVPPPDTQITLPTVQQLGSGALGLMARQNALARLAES